VSDNATAVIVQPCFLPWRGYFDLLSRARTVIFLDTVQYVDRSWYNRNRIMTAQGPKWITVPLKKSPQRTTILDKRIDDSEPWRERMLATIRHAYARAPAFAELYPDLSETIAKPHELLRDLAVATIDWGFRTLGRPLTYRLASEFDVDAPTPVGRLIALCKAVGATEYLSGPTARDYIADDGEFRAAGINLRWMEYSYPDYPQVAAHRETPLSIVDLLFNTGDTASRYIWPRAGH